MRFHPDKNTRHSRPESSGLTPLCTSSRTEHLDVYRLAEQVRAQTADLEKERETHQRRAQCRGRLAMRKLKEKQPQVEAPVEILPLKVPSVRVKVDRQRAYEFVRRVLQDRLIDS